MAPNQNKGNPGSDLHDRTAERNIGQDELEDQKESVAGPKRSWRIQFSCGLLIGGIVNRGDDLFVAVFEPQAPPVHSRGAWSGGMVLRIVMSGCQPGHALSTDKADL